MLTYGGRGKSHKNVKIGRHMNDRKTYELFRNVVYVLDDSLPELLKTRLRKLLLNNGGTPGGSFYDENSQPTCEDIKPNLYISQDKLYPHSSESTVHSVTPLWVEKAVSLGFVHNLSYYSPVLKQFLSGVVLLLLDLPDADSNSIKNEIKRYGGQYRDDFSEDITHLVCLDPRGTQYTQCIEQNIPAVLPQWLDDCFRQRRKVETDLYQFPNPIVYYENSVDVAKLYPYYDKEAFASSSPEDDYNMVFEDEVFYFGKDITFKEDFKQILTEAIVKAGGAVVDKYNHQHVTIVILKHRLTHECKMAYKDKKLIASLWWVTNTLSRRYWCSPLSTLLDYPTPPGGLPGMENCVISIAGYGNVTRYYLRRLLLILGAKYDPGLTSDTTHLICGRATSEKYKDATERPNHLTIVNHIWLEECFQQWKLLDTTADERYKFIPNEKKLLGSCAGKLHLLDTELQRWMEPDTIPAYRIAKFSYERQSSSGDERGSLHVRKRRKAAVAATSMLNAIMPDANAFERERSKQSYR